jgi:hypothetical protein
MFAFSNGHGLDQNELFFRNLHKIAIAMAKYTSSSFFNT